jgi:hypothetical protein
MFLFDLVSSTPTAEPDTPVNGLWTFLPIGYLLTILVETPVLIVGLSRRVTLKQKILCGIWLSACTYPIVVLVMPMLFADWQRWQYLTVAEIFAPVAECVLFWLVFRRRGILNNRDWVECFVAIVVANLASFGVGEIFNYYGWFGLISI